MLKANIKSKVSDTQKNDIESIKSLLDRTFCKGKGAELTLTRSLFNEPINVHYHKIEHIFRDTVRHHISFTVWLAIADYVKRYGISLTIPKPSYDAKQRRKQAIREAILKADHVHYIASRY